MRTSDVPQPHLAIDRLRSQPGPRPPARSAALDRGGRAGYVEMHALKLPDPDVEPLELARAVGEGELADYQCACALAEMVGIKLDDG
jgi:hypothetical protein